MKLDVREYVTLGVGVKCWSNPEDFETQILKTIKLFEPDAADTVQLPWD